jgi:WD40 repeat protein
MRQLHATLESPTLRGAPIVAGDPAIAAKPEEAAEPEEAQPTQAEAAKPKGKPSRPPKPLSEKTWITSRSDRAVLGIGDADGRFRIIDLERGTLEVDFDAGEFITRACWTRDNTRLLLALYDGRVQIRSGNGLLLFATVESGHGTIRGLAVHPSKEHFITCGDDGRASVWDLRGEPIRSTPTFQNDVRKPIAATACTFFADRITVGYASGAFEGFDEETLKNDRGGEVLTRGVAAMATTTDGKKIIMGGAAGSMLSLDADWRIQTTWKGTPPKPIAVNAIACQGGAEAPFVAAYSDGSAGAFASTETVYASSLGEAFYLQSPKPDWERNLIVSGACYVGNSSVVATSHFDSAVKLWYGYFSAEITFVEYGFQVTAREQTYATGEEIATWWQEAQATTR